MLSFFQQKPIRNVFAVLDLGSFKVACIIVKVVDNNLEIVGSSYVHSDSIKSGAIMNVSSAKKMYH